MNTCEEVYKINCKSYPATYVGETKWALKNRIKEHQNDKNSKSLIALHSKNNSHTIDWYNIQILDKENNYNKRIVSEMIPINSTKKIQLIK